MILISEVQFKAADHYRKPSEPVASDHELIDCTLRMTFDSEAPAKEKRTINGVDYNVDSSYIKGVPDIYCSWFNGVVRNGLGLDANRENGVYKASFEPLDIRKDHIAMMGALMEAMKDILEQKNSLI